MIMQPANTNLHYPKITIADFDIPNSKSIIGGDSSPSPIDSPTGLATRLVDASVAPIHHLSAPSHPKRSDAPGNVFVAPLTLSGATL